MQVSSLLSSEEEQTTPKRMPPPKSVSFEFLLDEGLKTRARIPLRVLVNRHDSTESIVTTVKNFYGIYDGRGVGFEDAFGNTLIASYENLAPDSTVYVRIVLPPQQAPAAFPYPTYINDTGYEPKRRPSLGEPFQMLPPHMREQSHSPSRPASRTAFKRSVSPTQGRGRRSASQQKGTLITNASRASSVNGSYNEDDGYSDSEAGRSSVSGSKKARSEQYVSSEISTLNVLQDGRRGQAIFDSSALPLFVPPQVPVTASQSSISPQRRSIPQEGPSPFHPPAQKLYGLQQVPVLSPQSYGPNNNIYGPSDRGAGAEMATPVPQHGHRLRDRSSMQQIHGGRQGSGILPTPDPTVASCISDEDVARTLIAMGGDSNYSYGRTSNSTVDETFSGAADAASSTGATSDSDEYSEDEGGLPKHRKFLEEEEEEDEEYDQDITSRDHGEFEGQPKMKKIKTKMHDGPTNGYRSKSTSSMKSGKPTKIRSNTLPKTAKPSTQQNLTKVPSAPAAPGQVRKSSGSSLNFQHQLGVDEEDLSSKPRCQRCRKSKKGCDRQRPCGRCKDAGIGIDGCVSEDEGNGRKGRYGRHMGVSVKKGEEDVDNDGDSLIGTALGPMGGVLVNDSPDKSKKRKR